MFPVSTRGRLQRLKYPDQPMETLLVTLFLSANFVLEPEPSYGRNPFFCCSALKPSKSNPLSSSLADHKTPKFIKIIHCSCFCSLSAICAFQFVSIEIYFLSRLDPLIRYHGENPLLSYFLSLFSSNCKLVGFSPLNDWIGNWLLMLRKTRDKEMGTIE